jgi:hypothetical protein
MRVLNVGGNLSNTGNAGVSALNANNDSSNANDNIGSRSTEYICCIESLLLKG